jgi:hypothetical protein
MRLLIKKVLISESNQRTKMVQGKKGLPARSASLSFNPMRKADIRYEESKALATDRVIWLITPTGRGTVIAMTGEAVCEIDCLSVLCNGPYAEGFLQIFTISNQTAMCIRVIKDKGGSAT